MTNTITLPRSVVEQALEALDEIAWSNNTRRQSDRADDARIALRAALEQPQGEQEPVAWMDTETRVLYGHDTSEVDRRLGFKPTVPLYTHPQPKREPLDTDTWPEYPAPSVRPVYATSANTKSVRDGFEVGGYEKTPPLFTKSQLYDYALNVLRAHGIGGEA